MSTSLHAWFTRLAVPAIAMIGGSATAAISIGAAGVNNANAILTFSAAPAVTEWATGNANGSANQVTDLATMTTLVQTQTAAGISTIVGTNAVNTYTAAATFVHQGPAQHLSSTSGTGKADFLLATLQNNAGSTINSFDAVFDFGIQSAGSDDLPGFFMYYSTTGAASSWVSLGQIQLAGTSTNSIAPTGGWLSGTNLYLLWADDNSQANPDGAYTFDNFRVNSVVSVPEPGRVSLLGFASAMFVLRRRRR